MGRSRPSALALAALCASAAALAVVVMGRGRSVELCAGGCMTHGIPGESRSPLPPDQNGDHCANTPGTAATRRPALHAANARPAVLLSC